MTEWNNLKYRLMEEIGENMDIIVFRHHHTDGTLETHIRNHAIMDGTGAFCDVLEKSENITFTEQPMRQAARTPNAFFKLILGLRFWWRTRKPQISWKPGIDFKVTGRSETYCFYTFPPPDTQAIKAFCQTPGLSLTTLALKSLDTAAAKQFLDGPCTRPWVIPANMRGAVTSQYQLGNYSTSILLHTDDEDTPESIYSQMRSFLQKGLLWGSWVFTNLPRFMSEKTYRKMVHGMGNAAFGSISNMGEGPTEFMVFPNQDTPVNSYIWSGCPPSSKVVPMNATVFIWADQLVLTLKLHPSLETGGEQTSKLMKDWLDELTQRVGNVTLDPQGIHSVPIQAIYDGTPLKYPRSE